MGLISPGGENLLDFLELRHVLSIYDGDHRDMLWWPQERSVIMRVTRGPLGFISRRCWGLRLPGASVRKPARDKFMRKEADIRKACSDIWTPLEIFKHLPQQKSAGFCALLFHSSDLFWKKSIQRVSLLHLKECFNPKTLRWLSSLPVGLIQLRL